MIEPKKTGCWVIGCTEHHTEQHHAYYGAGCRLISDKNGFIANLCPTHHRSQPQGVHGGNRELDLAIKRYFQAEYEKEHLRFDFMKLINRNYLD